MSDIILKVENISKQYRLGVVGTGTLSHDLNRWWHKIRGKEDPYLKIGDANSTTRQYRDQYVWALNDINFEVKKGEVLGIIGKNGAGKSTLLKILSQVTIPTKGQIKSRGRIASLLEVGTGFHPEMTGRENIYLNGAILGMTKVEITGKIDEIIDFSGCRLYIDTPVKRYSSGMRVRLAFSVAAFLEPDILVVDEVLAVGDAEFQKKAVGKMQDISKTDGRTVLFVSHNMAAVRSLCSKGILLESGQISKQGDINTVIQEYLSSGASKYNLNVESRSGSGVIKVKDIKITGETLELLPENGHFFQICIDFDNPNRLNSNELRLDLKINDYMGHRVGWMSNYISAHESVNDLRSMRFCIESLNLNHGLYYISTDLYANNKRADFLQNAIAFEVSDGDFYGTGRTIPIQESKILLNFETKLIGNQ